MLFDGLMRQGEINCMLDELFGDREEASPYGAESMILTLSEEEREWGSTPKKMPPCSLLKATSALPS